MVTITAVSYIYLYHYDHSFPFCKECAKYKNWSLLVIIMECHSEPKSLWIVETRKSTWYPVWYMVVDHWSFGAVLQALVKINDIIIHNSENNVTLTFADIKLLRILKNTTTVRPYMFSLTHCVCGIIVFHAKLTSYSRDSCNTSQPSDDISWVICWSCHFPQLVSQWIVLYAVSQEITVNSESFLSKLKGCTVK